MSENALRIKILRELEAEWDAEYEKLTLDSGAYRNMKVRAAYVLASGLARAKAVELEKELNHE